jgi:CRISPR-associated endonuclease/helicase Cas3
VTPEEQKEFGRRFCELTGKTPLLWQIRMFGHFVENSGNNIPSVIDLPTGLGKTMVMAIWLIAHEKHPHKIPTRLIYVVDRRTVVDQASDIARTLQEKYGKDKLAISTLRGQLADNREWSADPSRPAIIIGTVDLIGSALLFSGYRSSFKRRPLEAGLLGQDSLLVLDEAHLSKPFEKLICEINDTGRFQKTRDDKAQGKPMRVIRMSATSNEGEKNRFKLEDVDLIREIFDDNGNVKPNPIVERFEAKKTLRIEPLAEKQRLADRLADEALSLIAPANSQVKPVVGARIVVFVRTPEMARDVVERIRASKKGDFASAVEVLTGTMRGLERDKLVKKPVFEERWLNGDLKPSDPANQSAVFLVSTSAGEVGFDLNADHMVCDATTIDSLIQRLGRVNRRGLGDAQIRLFVEPPKKDKDGKSKKLEGLELAIANTIGLLQEITSVSPKNIAALKASLEWKAKDEYDKSPYERACSPEPTMVELTDILLDAWSMTSITEPVPGRPEVSPWLRGIAEELPETVIAWRAELDLPGFDQLDLETIEEWFDTHRVLTHETLSVPTSAAAKWFTDRWDKLQDRQKFELGSRRIIVDRAGLKFVTVSEVLNQLGRKNTDSIRNANLILPASFGGIERGNGLLDAEAPTKPADERNADEATRNANAKARLISSDVADERGRYREKIEKSEDGGAVTPSLIPKASKPTEMDKYSRFALELDLDKEQTFGLVSYVRKYEKPETGVEEQSLEQHVEAVRKHANAIIGCLNLAPDDPIRMALELAADWHDHGKNREFFQRTVVGARSNGQRPWPDHVKGKSGGKDRGRPARGYRHEFGSLCEFIDAHPAGKDITKEVIDLAAHLIVTHHGRGRPHFPKGGFDPDSESRSDDLHTESIRRFARLQGRYGRWHLAWLENLLRCADAMASSEQGAHGGEK